ncbi:putative phosphoglycerate mutase pmu1 [Friedmanniomyces endolithicus]|uniref:Phosphoglycerate mutase pmu1 n=1 Tax=Friedmanniomyces endolithicus TaxID=329885 RepID=A0AAN6G106_9PEZI|nr:putative phosphoglycerate mutase pmu1 [Friedmanniomyces endolithicus]KAK0294383.1 putative phosphoglycerate mutase pmu1 [Friedmanniomyces endolithicus]KAK0326761.1 putative phosphoglycerate mutase pmu1 [Friedmanniomyces endolithicus]KAK1013397.1 putative phosphoglycerate mutase pmu1 [Friedmanniomyces endolithicus]
MVTFGWEDAKLTSRGETEAGVVRQVWERAMATEWIASQDRYFGSPLVRCLQTANLTYHALSEATTAPTATFPLTLSEGLREIHGVHTCDRHGSRASISSAFDFIDFDDDVPEVAGAWQQGHRETPDAAQGRLQDWAERLFCKEKGPFVSATTHTGAIRALYRAIGHPDVLVARGSLTPLTIKATSG